MAGRASNIHLERHRLMTPAFIAVAFFLTLVAGLRPLMGLVLIGAVLAFLLVLVSFHHQALSAYILAAIIPFDLVRILPGAGANASLAKVAGVIVLGSWVLGIVIGRVHLPNRESRKPLLMALVFVTWSIITIAWAGDIGTASDKSIRLTMLLLSAVVVASTIRTESELRRLAFVQVGFAVAVGIVSIAEFVLSGATLRAVREEDVWGSIAIRQTGFIGDANDFAVTQVIAFSVAISLALTARSLVSTIICYLGVLIIIGSLLVTVSRGGTLAFIVVAICWLWSRKRSIPIVIPSAIVGVLVLNSYGAFDLLLARSSTSGSDPRLLIWDVALKLWINHPITGIGINQFPQTFFENMGLSNLPIPRPDNPLVAHNLFLSVGVETGIIGCILFLTFLASVGFRLRGGARVMTSSSAGVLVKGYFYGLTGFLVAAMFLSAEVDKTLWLIAGISAALTSPRAIYNSVGGRSTSHSTLGISSGTRHTSIQCTIHPFKDDNVNARSDYLP